MPKKKSARRRSTHKKRKPPGAKAVTRARMATPGRRPARSKRRSKVRGKNRLAAPVVSIDLQHSGPGPGAAGQFGEIERLSTVARADSETVEELAEEGQPFEAEVLAGIEEADDADESEVTTHEVLEDDVPSEYDGEH